MITHKFETYENDEIHEYNNILYSIQYMMI